MRDRCRSARHVLLLAVFVLQLLGILGTAHSQVLRRDVLFTGFEAQAQGGSLESYMIAQAPVQGTPDDVWPDLFQLGLKVGGGTFSYREESAIASGRFNGKVLLGELLGGVRLTERIRFSLAATGAFTGSDSEEFTRTMSATGAPGSSQQENDLNITLLLLEPDFRYRALHTTNLEVDVIVGWGGAFLTLDRRKITIDGSAVPGSFQDSFVAHGPRFGAATRFVLPQLPRPLSFLLEATYNNFMGVNVESDFLEDEAFTRGFGVKWNVGVLYHLTPTFTFGFGYQGLLLEFDRSDRVSGGTGTIRQGGQVPENTSRVDAVYLNLHWKFGQ